MIAPPDAPRGPMAGANHAACAIRRCCRPPNVDANHQPRPRSLRSGRGGPQRSAPTRTDRRAQTIPPRSVPLLRHSSDADHPPRPGYRPRRFNYMGDRLCDSTSRMRPHRAVHRACYRVGAENRSDVRSQGPGRARTSASTGRLRKMIAHRWERNLKDVGDQALMCRLDTQIPRSRPGLSRSYNGRRLGRIDVHMLWFGPRGRCGPIGCRPGSSIRS
jgi:hypothetical protein